MLETSVKVQYLCTLVRGEALRQFDALSDDVESGTPLIVEAVILGLGSYFFPVNFLPKKNREMQREMRKPHRL